MPSQRSEAPLDEAMGPDLLALVRAHPGRLAKCDEITTLASPVRRRGAFRLEFEDGTVLKGRRLRGAEDAEQVRHRCEQAGRGYARVLECRGDALLTEWIDGTPLDRLQVPEPVLLRRCGRMLGRLHMGALSPEEAARARHGAGTALDGTAAHLEEHAGLLCSEGWLASEQAERIIAIARMHRPESADLGIIHKDFCAENIVLSAHGEPVVVDNTKLTVGPLDRDLAATWYRWPQSASQRRDFATGYEEHRSLSSLLAHFPFWALRVLIGSASTRVRARTGRVETPIERLHALLAALDDGCAEHPYWRA